MTLRGECEGTWGYPREVGESEPTIAIQRCSGCREQMAIFKYRGFGPYPAHYTDEEIARAVLSG